MSIFTTEITSEKLVSDNPLHNRLLSAYCFAEKYLNGNVLELGCGEGRGVEIILRNSKSFTAIDKIKEVITNLRIKYPSSTFINSPFPPLDKIENNTYDTIISFQVIEHLKDDDLFLKEIYRVLKPGGKALISTPNRKMTLSRNPWHIREYISSELKDLSLKYFDNVTMKGISGNQRVQEYFNDNRKSVNKFKKLDIFNLEKYLPNFLYRIPYEFLNRINRNSLHSNNSNLVSSISVEDYMLSDDNPSNLDLFLILEK